MSAFVTSEIFRLFVDTLTPDDKSSRRYIQIFGQQLQRSLSRKGMAVFRFFISFWNVTKIWNILSKKNSILP